MAANDLKKYKCDLNKFTVPKFMDIIDVWDRTFLFLQTFICP